MQVPLFRLQCGVNSYEWGKMGNESAAARFAEATPAANFAVQQDKPYAEVCLQQSHHHETRQTHRGLGGQTC